MKTQCRMVTHLSSHSCNLERRVTWCISADENSVTSQWNNNVRYELQNRLYWKQKHNKSMKYFRFRFPVSYFSWLISWLTKRCTRAQLFSQVTSDLWRQLNVSNGAEQFRMSRHNVLVQSNEFVHVRRGVRELPVLFFRVDLTHVMQVSWFKPHCRNIRMSCHIFTELL